MVGRQMEDVRGDSMDRRCRLCDHGGSTGATIVSRGGIRDVHALSVASGKRGSNRGYLAPISGLSEAHDRTDGPIEMRRESLRGLNSERAFEGREDDQLRAHESKRERLPERRQA